MTFAQLEERVTALERTADRLKKLEQAVEQLQIQEANGSEVLPSREQKLEMTEEDFVPDMEYVFVPAKPPAETIRLEAVIRWKKDTSSQGLGLSDAEWTSLGLEGNDE